MRHTPKTVLKSGKGRYRILFCWSAEDIEKIRKRTKELKAWFASMMEAE